MRLQLTLRTGLALAGLTFLLNTSAQAQEARLISRLPDAERAQVDSIIAIARGTGLPTEPLVDRALEGAAKRAPPDRIVMATSRLLAELQGAHRAFGDSASAGELTAGASALRAGAIESDLQSLRLKRGIQPLTVAASVLADLVAVGVSADSAVAAVLALAERLPDAQYIAFQRNIERDIAQGASPSAAFGVRFRTAADMASASADLELVGTPSGIPRKRKP